MKMSDHNIPVPQPIAEGRIAQAYGYARVSDPKQVEKGDSIPAQIERMEAYYQYKLQPMGVEWNGTTHDSGVSAYTVPFEDRKSVKQFLPLLREGDHVVIDKLDRFGRTMRDVSFWVHWFTKHNITMHEINYGIDTSQIGANFMLGMLALVAEAESAMKSQRTADYAEWARTHGRAYGKAPIGMKHKKRKGQLWRVWDRQQRTIMAQIVIMHDDRKMNFHQISRQLEMDLAAKHGRVFVESAFYKRTWTVQRCFHGYCAEKWLRDWMIYDTTNYPKYPRKHALEHCRKMGYI